MRSTDQRKTLTIFARRLAPEAVLDPPGKEWPETHTTTLYVRRSGIEYTIHLDAHDERNYINLKVVRDGEILARISQVADFNLLEHLMHQVITYDVNHAEEWGG